MRRRLTDVEGLTALRAWVEDPDATARATQATAVRYTLQRLADLAPGNSVEVRVPPVAVVQCVAGPRHTRGTPPAVVETDAGTWLALVTDELGWEPARQAGRLTASGERADLSALLTRLRPLIGLE